MSTARRIAKNTGVMFISQITTYVLSFLYLMYSARYLGTAGYGVLSFGLAFAAIAGIFMDVGLSPLLVREIARDKSLLPEYVQNITTIKIFLALVTLVSSIVIVYSLNYSQEVIKVVFFATLFYVFSSFSSMFYSVFQAHEQMEYPSFGLALNSALLLGGTLYAVSHNFNVLGFAILFFIVSLITFIYALIVTGWKYVFPKISINWDFCKLLIKEALPLSFALIFTTIAFRIDTVIISLIKGTTAVGIYTAAYRLMEVLIFVPAVFTSAIYPVFSNYHVSSQESLKISYKKSFKYLSLIGLPISVGTTLLADKIILLLYGSQFTQSIIALKILIWTVPFIFLTYTFGILMISINKQQLYLKIILVSMIINIILNIIFIPSLSYIGASYITIITEVTSFVLFFYFLSQYICKIPLQRIVIKPAIASLIMGLFIMLVNINIFILVPMATIVYLASLILLKTFSEDDIKIFKQITNIGK